MSSSVEAAGRGMSRALPVRTGFVERTVIALSMASLRWARRREARLRLTHDEHALRRINEITLERERLAAAARRRPVQ